MATRRGTRSDGTRPAGMIDEHTARASRRTCRLLKLLGAQGAPVQRAPMSRASGDA
jgi:hypothetical protein